MVGLLLLLRLLWLLVLLLGWRRPPRGLLERLWCRRRHH
jgi:hypothetical protein